jgi:ABC-type nitrate/sulfonate/bicarbonate transport system permease component
MAPGTPPRGRRLTGTLITILLEAVLPAAILGGWRALSARSSAIYFPPLSSILGSLRQVWLFAHFGSDAVPSLVHLALGMAIALVAGVLGGLGLGLAPFAADALSPVLEFLRAIPGVALVPAALLLLGIGPSMQISLIAYGTLWPILLNTLDGVRSVDPVVHEVALSYRLSRWERITRVVLPAASPQIIAGVRTALSVGITVIVFSEMVGSTSGIGFQILAAQRTFAISDMWAGMIFLGIVGYLLNVAFRAVEAALLGWHRGMRAQGADA